MINSWHALSLVLQLERNVALPPPEALKGKIIIKNKKKHVEKPSTSAGEHTAAAVAAPGSSASVSRHRAPQITLATGATAAADEAGVGATAGSERLTSNEAAVGINDLGECVAFNKLGTD